MGSGEGVGTGPEPLGAVLCDVSLTGRFGGEGGEVACASVEIRNLTFPQFIRCHLSSEEVEILTAHPSPPGIGAAFPPNSASGIPTSVSLEVLTSSL